MDTVNIAILGAGSIAHAMAATVAQMPVIKLRAVAARDIKRAEVFAQQYGFEKAYGSYEDLVQDDEIDLVYIATPHSHHAEHAMLCLRHGIAVLCEKAFTGNARQAREVLDYAHEHKIFITEAIWTRYMPLARTLKELVADGDAAGHISGLTAGLGFPLSHVERMTEPALAGGALLDLGVYPINFASIAFGGNITKITSDAILTDKGVDAQNAFVLHYREGRLASLGSNMAAKMSRNGVLFGDDGTIVVENINNFERIRVFDKDDKERAVYERPAQISGYEYEVYACVEALREKRIECPEMPHSETLHIMELLDTLRAQWGVQYPFD